MWLTAEGAAAETSGDRLPRFVIPGGSYLADQSFIIGPPLHAREYMNGSALAPRMS